MEKETKKKMQLLLLCVFSVADCLSVLTSCEGMLLLLVGTLIMAVVASRQLLLQQLLLKKQLPGSHRPILLRLDAGFSTCCAGDLKYKVHLTKTLNT